MDNAWTSSTVGDGGSGMAYGGTGWVAIHGDLLQSDGAFQMAQLIDEVGTACRL